MICCGHNPILLNRRPIAFLSWTKTWERLINFISFLTCSPCWCHTKWYWMLLDGEVTVVCGGALKSYCTVSSTLNSHTVFENSPKLSNTFACIRKWFYLVVLVLLHWNKHNRATFFGKYKILWGSPSLWGGTPWRSYQWPGPATNMLFLPIYQKYFIIQQTYNKNKLF
jgi:hypothetical protein